MGYEADVTERLARWREAQRQALNITQTRDLPDLSEALINQIKSRHKAGGGSQ
jgi:hypothetical protein